MRLRVLFFVVLGGSLWAQPAPLAQVKDFLQLSDQQIQTLLGNNDGYNQWSSEKQARIQQLQSEIAEETERDSISAMALGARYAEIENICREMKTRANEYRSRNLEALNQDQRAKLKVLEDASRLAPVIYEAQYGNLMGALGSAPLGFTGNTMRIGGAALGGFFGGPPVSGCNAGPGSDTAGFGADALPRGPRERQAPVRSRK